MSCDRFLPDMLCLVIDFYLSQYFDSFGFDFSINVYVWDALFLYEGYPETSIANSC